MFIILIPSVDGLLATGSTIWLIIGLVMICAGILVIALDKRGIETAE